MDRSALKLYLLEGFVSFPEAALLSGDERAAIKIRNEISKEFREVSFIPEPSSEKGYSSKSDFSMSFTDFFGMPHMRYLQHLRSHRLAYLFCDAIEEGRDLKKLADQYLEAGFKHAAASPAVSSSYGQSAQDLYKRLKEDDAFRDQVFDETRVLTEDPTIIEIS